MKTTSQYPAALTAAPAKPSEAKKSANQAITSDFETFLKMLTAQMQNQDPLNPMDASDYAVQLATFSGVEQQVKTNDLLNGLGAKLGLMGLADIAGWVGMEARVSSPVYFDQTAITLKPNPATGADEARLVVKNAFGTIVENKIIPVSRDAIEWRGTDSSGNVLPSGVYSFELISSGKGKQLSTTPVEAYGRITETQNADGSLWLILEGGGKVAAETVAAVREVN